MAYKWNYSYVGGITRVCVASGEDIRHLGELDKKMWTVLSCPVKGLEIDEQSLKYIDTNGDGAIHVDEVIAVSQWLSSVLKANDVLLTGKDQLSLNLLNQDNEEGKALYDAAKQILTQLGKADAEEISLADSTSALQAFLKAKYEAALAALDKSNAVEAPYGDQTDAVEAAYKALDAKVRDYFMRAKLAGFAKESTTALDLQVAQVEAISADNLTARMDEIAAYPIARIDGSETLSLSAPINPAWAGQFAVIRQVLAPETTELDEAAWGQIGAAIQAYRDYQASIDIKEESIALDAEAAQIQLVDKLLHLMRDFFTLLKNYVTLQDFYTRDKKAIFQAGTLIVDQRACDLTLKVADAGALGAQAGKSGMFLLVCDVTSKVWAQTYKIVSAVTVGETDDLFVGKNAIFYDRAGHDFDAKIVQIIENPISVRQAIWTPYKKFAKFVEDQINKFAGEKESGVMSDATASFSEKAEAAKAGDAAGVKPAAGFDIAKFAGIFAAIGMALGMLGSALVAVVGGFLSLSWWQMPLVILAIMILISGPSMLLAWLKLRKRNLSPVLNANGWAINAGAKINVPFGASLTQRATFPASAKLRKTDPFAEKTPLWKRLLNGLLTLVVVGGILYCVALRFGLVEWCPEWLEGLKPVPEVVEAPAPEVAAEPAPADQAAEVAEEAAETAAE